MVIYEEQDCDAVEILHARCQYLETLWFDLESMGKREAFAMECFSDA